MNAPVAWLLDTNVVSEMTPPEAGAARREVSLDSVAEEGIGLAAITVWEILNGIGQLNPGQRRNTLAERVQFLLDDLFEERGAGLD